MTIQKKVLVLVDGSERAIQTVNYVKDFMPIDPDTRMVLFDVFSGIPEEYPGKGYTAVALRRRGMGALKNVGRRGLSKVEAFFMGRVGHEVVFGGKKFTVWVA